MHRLVIALTSLLSVTAAAVVAGYLFLFSGPADAAARLMPAGTPAYVRIHLQPSPAQQTNLAALLGRLPGFADAATLDEKVDQIVQNLLGDAGLDYRSEIKPWLGDQVAVGMGFAAADPAEVDALAVVAVKDRAAAESALAAIAEREGRATRSESYQGVSIVVDDGGAYAFLDELLVLAGDPDRVRQAIDVHLGAEPALADDAEFVAAMEAVPSDNLAAGYLDFAALAEAAGGPAPDGLSAASYALVAEEEGLRLAGQAPYDPSELDEAARAVAALQETAPTLIEWMPAGTQAELATFGLRQALETAEDAAAGTPEGEAFAEALAGARALAAFGFGIDIDADLLPLLDGEVALAIGDIRTDGSLPSGQLLLRPRDPAAAEASLLTLRERLESRGADSTERQVAGTTIVSLTVPELGEVSYATLDGVAILGLSGDDVAAALEAHASGETLAASDAYRSTFDLAGAHAGTELYVDLAALLDGLGAEDGLPADVRDILGALGSFGLTLPVHSESVEFHAVLTVR